MMLKINFRMAIDSLRSSRWRSFLTMLGIIVGVVSVVTVLSIGEGIKRSIARESRAMGGDVVMVLPGEQITRNDDREVAGYNPFLSAGFTLTETDVAEIQALENVDEVVSFVRVPGAVSADEATLAEATIIAVDGDAPRVLSQEIRFGTWHDDNEESTRKFAVIGSGVAQELFNELAPIGRSLTIGEHEFVVRGVFAEFPLSVVPFLSVDYNNTVMLSYDENKRLNGSGANIYQILVNPSDASQVDTLAMSIEEVLLESRNSSRDFSVVTRSELPDVYGGAINVITATITAIAALSLFVGGVGIMNIMFVSVSERTGEIGVRKAIGASNSQILTQFITEAAVLSFLGGVFGVLISLIVNYFIRISTILEPIIALELLGGAILVAFVVGIVFGTAPAIRAARKDPIDALRSRL